MKKKFTNLNDYFSLPFSKLLTDLTGSVVKNATKTLWVFFLLGFMPLAAIEQPKELAELDLLIESTQQSVQQQLQLRELLKTYVTLRENFRKNPDDNELLYKAIKAAKAALSIIQEQHLTHSFDSEFIKELNLFATVGSKQGIPT